MAEAGFTSHKAFARAVRRVSEEQAARTPIGCDHTSVSRWLSGMSPRSDTAQCIVTALGRSLGRRVSLAEAGLAASAAIPPDLGLDYHAAAEDALGDLARLWHADLDQSAAVIARPEQPAAWQSAPLSWLLSSGRNELPSGTVNGPRVGSSDVTRVHATIGMFVELDNRFGGGHARRALIRYLTDDLQPLLNGRYGDGVAGLFSAAAQATLLAAWMSYDSGLHGLAQRYFIQALRLAEAGDDRPLAGSILDAMSHQATFLGRYQHAADLARAARTGTEHVATASLTAHFHAMEARALARLGDARGCELALSAAVSLFERRRPGDDPDWFGYFNDSELAAEFGHCYRDVRRASSAASYAAQSIGNTCGARSDFFVTMVLAEAHLQAGDAEQACHVALEALHLGNQLASARCAQYLRDFHTALTPAAGSPAVRDFQEQARTSALWQRAAASPDRRQ
ncbi:MAG: hypothetical protein ACLPUO_06980 [Streptosporangiaceae bacterium]